MIGIIDLGISNIASVTAAFSYLGCETNIITNSEDLSNNSGIVLPGVGAFGDGMKALEDSNLIEPIKHYVKEGFPILGVCLGMQLMTNESEEFGFHEGLNLVPGKVVRLKPCENECIPNIGWCDIDIRPKAKLFNNTQEKTSFYFVHSYHMECEDERDIAATIDFGNRPVTVAIQKENIFGLQCHPEKSQDAGLQVLDSFISIVRNI
jgi:glutamine amidotransferase